MAAVRSVHRYGEAADQAAELFLPAGGRARRVVAVIHGGFWRLPWGRDYTEPVCEDLAAHGFAAWNVEYRRVGPGGLECGWPRLFEDVAAAVDALADVAATHGLDLSTLAALGHSAGGHLALWTAARPRLPAGAPGSKPRVRVAAAVSQGGVCDVVEAARRRLGDGAAQDLLGGEPDEVPDRYAAASPRSLLPLGVPQLLVHGTEDADVPHALAEGYAAAARAAGDAVELASLAGVGHDEHVEPDQRAWALARRWLEEAP